MSKTLYVQVYFKKLHLTSVPDPGAKLMVGSVEVGNKYALHFAPGGVGGYGLAEYAIAGATFEKPLNLSETATFETGSSTTPTVQYSVWRQVSVDDFFGIPPEVSSPVSSFDVEDFKDGIVGWLRGDGHNDQADLIEDIWDTVSPFTSAYDLYDSLKTHLVRQFQAMDDVQRGKISVDQFLDITTDASLDLEEDLLNTKPASRAMWLTPFGSAPSTSSLLDNRRFPNSVLVTPTAHLSPTWA